MTMNDRRILPGSQAQLIDKAGRATPPFYDFMRRLIIATSQPLTPDLSGATFLTEANETITLPNSRRLQSGLNIAFDESSPGILIINSLDAGGDSDAGYPAQLGHAGI